MSSTIKNAMPAPLIDMGNYPVIFSTAIARVDRLPNGLVSLMLVEDRMSCGGVMERIVVARIIRPAHSLVLTSRQITDALAEADGAEQGEIVVPNSSAPVRVQ